MTKNAAAACVLVAATVAAATTWRVEAHKPITSPYTFTEDVLPILRDRCTACHVAGGPAPMALTTAEDTVPWGESIRLELVAGHMPPWSAVSNGSRLRHAEGLTARELNVLLTWVTGGTPINAPPPGAPAPAPAWSLGAPDAIVPLPEAAVAADQAELTKEFVLPLDATSRRPLRAVDLKPGTRSLVRSAQISVKTATQAGDVERLLALWVPGDTPVPLPDGASLDVPNDAELVVRVRYKKTWEHERDAMSDRSELGLYFASGTPVRRLALDGQPLRGGVRVLSVYPSASSTVTRVTLDATSADGATRRIIEFTPRPGWDRRYAFDPPIDLPAGTRLQGSPPGALVVNVVPLPSR
ncbi:MAG TPA: hypothetical protein VFD69_05565 [Vicinamibacterales bacterium]|nr:hypothetical protein [Vicinamibacterales bacterium]